LEASFHESVQILQSDAIATAKRLVLSGGNAKWLGRILAEETQHEFVPISGLEIPWAEVQPRLQKIAAAGPETWRTRWRMRPQQIETFGAALRMFRLLGETVEPEHLRLSGLALKEALLLQSAETLGIRNPAIQIAPSYDQPKTS